MVDQPLHSVNSKKEDSIERFFNENKGMLPPAVERLMKEIIGEYANGDSVLLQKSELKEAFAKVLEDGSLDGEQAASTKERIINAVEQVQAASSLSEKAVSDILDIFAEMRELLVDVEPDDTRKQLNAKISAALELCTFEDIAAQHMGKALKLMKQTCDNSQEAQEGDALLNGPALPGAEGMSQEDIDKLLNG